LRVVTIAYTAARWVTFGATTAAVGATLSGLVFVAVSINLNRILGHPSLPARAWQTLGLLVTPLLIGFFLLVPGQSSTVLAWEMIVTAFLFCGARLTLHHQAARSEKDNPLPLVGHLAGFVTALVPALVSYTCVAVAGATLLAKDGGGLYWLVPSILVAIFFGLINAWALLVEIPL
jgi:hypothetical protein